MKTHNDTPGSSAWHARRGTCFNASDAAAMLGCSPHETRNQLLARLHSGMHKEFSDFAQERVIDPGHEYEAKARPLAEEIIGDALAPVGGSQDFGLSRPLGASFDGLTMLSDVEWEHKRMNEELRAALHPDRKTLVPKHYLVQLEQQLMVSGAEKALFMATRWEGDTCAEEAHVWYTSNPQLRSEILAGWKQFDADLADYVPAEPVQKIIAEPVQALPAVLVQVTGTITLIDNFKVFETALRDFLDHRLVREPKTDDDFAKLDVQIKAMKGAEAALEAAEGQMLAQVQDIDTAKKTKDMLHKMVRDNRLMAEKLLASEKERRRGEIVQKARAVYEAHEKALIVETGGPWIVLPAPDFAGKAKGLRSIDSIQNAVDTELASAKIAADESARKIRAALACIAEESNGYEFLIADRLALIGRPVDDLRTLIRARITEHQAEEKRRAEAAAEKERERIRAEEAMNLRVQQREQEAAAARAQAPAPTQSPAPAPVASPALSSKPPAANSPVVVPIQQRTAPAAQQPDDEWHSPESMPKEPQQWIQVQEVVLYRWLPYKPASSEARCGIKGRWQRHNGYGFENSEAPTGPWRIGEEAQVAP